MADEDRLYRLGYLIVYIVSDPFALREKAYLLLVHSFDAALATGRTVTNRTDDRSAIGNRHAARVPPGSSCTA